MIVARDLAHGKLRERLERGQGLPDHFKNHPVYYAGPAKTPQGYASRAFGPTTAGRMDAFVHDFQAAKVTRMAAIKVTDMAYGRLKAPDLDLMEEFLTRFGMARSERTNTALYMRGTD